VLLLLFVVCVLFREGFVIDLVGIDRASRELEHVVPRSVIECVESGANPSFLTSRYVADSIAHNEQVRAQVISTRLLHDQLQLRMKLWETSLQQQANNGDVAAKQLLEDTQTAAQSHAPAS
jgi:hypothetical protein